MSPLTINILLVVAWWLLLLFTGVTVARIQRLEQKQQQLELKLEEIYLAQ